MSSPPVKRQRTEDTSIMRSSVWYKDGILQAENTQFRPPDHPTIDGCPIVELHDSALEVDHLLTALYDPTFLSQTALPLAVVGSLIRLGRKYDFKTLLDSAVACLTSHNPTTLAEYDGKSKPTRIKPYPGCSLDLLTLARENNLRLVLPFAYYRALRCRTDQFLHAAQRKEATAQSSSLEDLCRCFNARQRLATKQFQPGYTLGWMREWPYPHAECDSPKRCDATRKHVFHSYMDKNTLQPFLDASQIEAWRECRMLPACCRINHRRSEKYMGGIAQCFRFAPVD
ncbi:hypothetical protein C8R45DRAFT_926289 [Mycena sanguinolenta]|nr:hypothetical protein C8R45DRAFT_926289 [Mycena sanguinolenta]